MLLPVELRDAIVAHAAFCLPEEACGLVAADASGRLRFAYCLTNAAASASRFTIDPAEHFGALRHAERHGWIIGGLFHSHVASVAFPSRSDVAGSPGPGWLHLVVGPMTSARPQVRGFRIEGGSVREVLVEAG